jgi:hypothetical protein
MHLDIREYVERSSAELNAITEHIQKYGFYKDCCKIVNEKEKLTHFLFYTIEGLLCYAIEFNNESLFNSLKDFVMKINLNFRYNNNFLPLALNENLDVSFSSTCVTGNAQLALINFIFYEKTNENIFLYYYDEIINQIKYTIDTHTNNKGVYGGIPSCFPFNKEYLNYCYINWGAKFFLDALIKKFDKI